jgi:hypothetical protein
MADERSMDSIDAGSRIDGGVVDELLLDLPGSPASLVPDLKDALDHVGRAGMGTRVRCVRTILETSDPLGLVAADPFVARRAADVVASAELGVREVTELGLDDEASAFLFHG